MKRYVLVVWLGVMALAAPGDLQAQTRADSAAVLLHTAERLQQEGQQAAARALLEYIERHFAGTPAATSAVAVRGSTRRLVAAEPSGRTELMSWGATYGAWLGVAVPLIAGSDEPAAYGVGLLAGAPAGFLAARAYARARQPSRGQARAITFGGSWGTFQGFGWAEALKLGASDVTHCDPYTCYYEDGSDTEARVASAVIGGLAGIGTGLVLAQKPITAGTAAVTTSGGLWGTWFGWSASFVAGAGGNAQLKSALLAGNAGLLATGLLASGLEISEPRVRLINVGGIIGGLAGVGLTLITQPDNEKTGIALPMLGSAAGLGLATHMTRDYDSGPDGGGAGLGALINRDAGRWAVTMPDATIRLERQGDGVQPAAYVPLLRARF
jgi:hypothetical protein